MEEKDYSPTDWYKSLPKKLKNFLIKGKELLCQVEDFLQFQEGVVGSTEKILVKEQKEDFGQLIIGFFKDVYEKDKSINEEDRGFRTTNEIYENYKNIIDISRPTFYNHFKKLNIGKFLEKRKNPGIGGGIQYKYKALEIRSLATKKVPKLKRQLEDKDFRNEKIKIQEALFNFKEKEYQNVIKIIDDILENPSEGLVKESGLHFSCLFYIGRSYYKLKEYRKALQYIEKINLLNDLFIDVRYYMILCRFKTSDYKNCLNDCIALIKNIEGAISNSEINLDYDHVRTDFFEYYDLEGVNRDKIKESNLSDLFIPLKTENNPIHLDLRFHDEIKNPSYFIKKFKKTVLSLRNTYKILIKLCYLRCEIIRRMVFRNIVENNHSEIFKQLDKLIKFLKKVEESYHFIDNRYLVFRPFLAYLRDLLELFDFNDMASLIKSEYPSLKDSEIYLPQWLFKSTQEHINYLNHLNSYFRSVHQDGKLYIYTKRKFIDGKLKIETYNEKLLIEKLEIDYLWRSHINTR